MQTKYKRAIIISVVSVIAFTLALILAGLRQVSLDEYGLNYNDVIANYTDTSVYGPGLYLLGLSNEFVKIKKNQQSIYFSIKTYTNDFYSLSASLEVSYLFSFTTTNSFATLTSFYDKMGEDPKIILQPLIKNQILIILSSKSSTYYQSGVLANSQLQTEIATQVQTVLSQYVGATISVIIESLVSEGTTTNTEIIDREIQSLIHDMERVSNEKVQLSDYYQTIYSKKTLEIQSAYTAIAIRAKSLDKILKTIKGTATDLTNQGVTTAIYDNLPTYYDRNMLNILQELVRIGNRTFPY